MKRWLLLIIVNVLTVFTAQAQAKVVIVSPEIIEANCAWGGKISNAIVLRNESNKAVTIKVKKVIQHLSAYQTTSFTLGDKLTSSELAESVNTFTLPPHQEEKVLEAHFSAGFKDHQAIVSYHFIDVYDSHEIGAVTIQYEILEELSEDLLYVSHDINISKPHPNPIRSKGIFDYRMATDHHNQIFIVIYNVLGKKMGEYPLSPERHQLLVDFSGWKQGVYFYTLVIDEKSIITKKIILRH